MKNYWTWKHNYKNPIIKGRAHYICSKCWEDITLHLVFMNKEYE